MQKFAQFKIFAYLCAQIVNFKFTNYGFTGT